MSHLTYPFGCDARMEPPRAYYHGEHKPPFIALAPDASKNKEPGDLPAIPGVIAPLPRDYWGYCPRRSGAPAEYSLTGRPPSCSCMESRDGW